MAWPLASIASSAFTAGCYDSPMRPGLRGGHLRSVLSIGIVLSIGFGTIAAPSDDFAERRRQATAPGQEALSPNPSGPRADYAAAAKAFETGIAHEPGTAAAWMEWADFDLERFRILDLELRSAQSGMAVLLRFEAQGWHRGPETREELLRQSAMADPEQQGIWGELGVEQVPSPCKKKPQRRLRPRSSGNPKIRGLCGCKRSWLPRRTIGEKRKPTFGSWVSALERCFAAH